MYGPLPAPPRYKCEKREGGTLSPFVMLFASLAVSRHVLAVSRWQNALRARNSKQKSNNLVAAAIAVMEQRAEAEGVALLGAASLCTHRGARHFLLHRPADHAGRRHGFLLRTAASHHPLGPDRNLPGDHAGVRFQCRPALAHRDL